METTVLFSEMKHIDAEQQKDNRSDGSRFLLMFYLFRKKQEHLFLL